MTRYALLMSLSLGLAGCATTSIVSPPPAALTPPPSVTTPTVDEDGGFTYGGGSLYSRRAREVGDVVTIKVAHNTTANSKATTSLARDGSTSMSVGALFGLETQLANSPGVSADAGPSLSLNTASTNDFSGDGSTDRAGTVSATLTARVIEVLPDGTLRLWGSQEVRVNNEVEALVVEGTVDPRSIGSDNSIPSSAIADLKIEYAGMGVVSGKQRPGWFTRVLDVVNPF